MSDSNTKPRDEKKRDETRRVEIAMLGVLIERYPKETREKVRKLLPDRQAETLFSSKDEKPLAIN